MKALVTGACGFLGSRLCNRLLAEGWAVVGIDRTSQSGANIHNPKLSFIQRDLSTQGLLPEEVTDADVVFHLAGSTLGAGRDEHLFFLSNELASLNVFKSCAGRVRKIVHASSQVVYGNIDSISVNEKFPLEGYDTAYGCSKVNSENWLRWFQKKEGGQAISLRLTGFIEGGGAIDYFIDRALRNEPIEVFDMGDICRDYLAVDDGIEAFIKTLSMQSTEPQFITYNIGSGEAIRTLDMAKFITSMMGSSSAIVPVAQKGPRPNFVFDICKAKSELQFEPTPLLKAVGQYISRRLGKSL